MPIYKVKKRNWSITTFDRSKIENAIIASIKASGGDDLSSAKIITNISIALVEAKVWKNIPNVEIIQDIVEEALIKEWHDKVAKSYILYRQKRSEQRSDKNVVIEVGKSMEEYLSKSDWRVNANANSWYSLWWMILNLSGKVTANYWLSHIYPAEIGNLHSNGN